MTIANGKSKKLVVYQDKRTGSIFLRPTRFENSRYVIKEYRKGVAGMAKSDNISDIELGKFIREALNQCD